ncbi:MAG: hypothetical protein K5793_06295 [Nitrosarchaeum sp.]|nr:hypothetical protein [Nitrosarchaeum sp.]MCV0398475.1 hypothetical protein [Nitrosarchaeum sp.]
MSNNGTFGNLQSYRNYTQPTVKRLFGDISSKKNNKSKHGENIKQLLLSLASNGFLTTWEIAKLDYSDTSSIRTREKQIRRLLVGRKDRGKKSPGVLDVGLIVSKKMKASQSISNSYGLSLHGVLYCLDVLDFSKKDVDQMAYRYSKSLPMVFGRWDYLKSILGDDVYRIKILASGLLLDNIHITGISQIPIFELVTYLNVKYRDNYESITETALADQISYWFYTALLIPSTLNKQKEHSELEKWKKIFVNDQKLKKWYFDFINDAYRFYSCRFDVIKTLEP